MSFSLKKFKQAAETQPSNLSRGTLVKHPKRSFNMIKSSDLEINHFSLCVLSQSNRLNNTIVFSDS